MFSQRLVSDDGGELGLTFPRPCFTAYARPSLHTPKDPLLYRYRRECYAVLVARRRLGPQFSVTGEKYAGQGTLFCPNRLRETKDLCCERHGAHHGFTGLDVVMCEKLVTDGSSALHAGVGLRLKG